MITPYQLRRMNDMLYDYDVRDGAWEQEPKGIVANATHVLTHLVKDVVSKKFNDPKTVRDQIAPDLLQYSMRLARWTHQDTSALLYPKQSTNAVLRGYESRLPGHSTGHVAVIAAAHVLAQNLHDHDHASTREAAVLDLGSMARRAGGLLLTGVDSQIVEFGFDPEEAFDNRIAALRERFAVEPRLTPSI